MEPNIKKTEAELKRTLEELYAVYFKNARQFANEADAESSYFEAKAHGGLEAVEAIYLWLYGGKEAYNLWQRELNKYDKTASS